VSYTEGGVRILPKLCCRPPSIFTMSFVAFRTLETLFYYFISKMVFFKSTLEGLLTAALFISSSPVLAAKRSLQPLPLSRNDRWIVDANNNHVPFVGINWPGAGETMLPEGLGYQSIANIVQKISQTGFNAVRLTFAIEMVDDILDNGGDVTLSNTLSIALGEANGAAMLGKILSNNPQFTANTTRLQVFYVISLKNDKTLTGPTGY